MPAGDSATRIRAQFDRHGLAVGLNQLSALEAYLGLLTKWNKTVNLTALNLSPLGEEAIDRLLVEPVLAAQFVQPAQGLLVDVGSGSGSPAIPLKIALPGTGLLMVESRARKAAFLREAIRHVGLEQADVEGQRLEQLTKQPSFHEAAAWVSVRAVRADPALWRAVSTLLAPQGRVLWFRATADETDSEDADYLATFELQSVEPLIPARRSELAILRRRTAPRLGEVGGGP